MQDLMITPTKLRAFVMKTLQYLGETPNDVAKRLKEGGFRGIRLHTEECPIARYLRARLEEALEIDASVSVTDREIEVSLLAANYDRIGASISPIPKGVQDFVLAFDRGAYPELVEED